MLSKFFKYKRGCVSFIVLAFASVCVSQYVAKEAYARDEKDEIFKELRVFTDVLAIVRRDYVEKVDSKKLVDGAVRGMLAALDPHSGYLDPDFYQDLQVNTKGHFGGLGIEITMDANGSLLVVTPMSGSPAERAGVEAGDYIVKINGKYTKGFSLVEAVKKLRGQVGSSVTLSLFRKDRKNLLEVNIVREDIKVISVKKRLLENGFGYVRITQFMDNTAKDLKKALDAMRAEGGELKGLVVDVRNNPGGLLNQAVAVSDMFLDDGIIVYTDGRVASQRKKFFAHKSGTEPDYPIVVLINGGSASASEILAGSIQDDGRGLILGTRTFGKGSVQTVTPLENGGALTLTTALYFTKSGRSIQATGVAPDIEFEVKNNSTDVREKEDVEDASLYIRESELDGALKNPDGLDDGGVMRRMNKTPQINKEVIRLDPERANLQDWLEQDKQVLKAINVLKSSDVYRSNIGKGLVVKEKQSKDSKNKK